jgi:hypothetical protein
MQETHREDIAAAPPGTEQENITHSKLPTETAKDRAPSPKKRRAIETEYAAEDNQEPSGSKRRGVKESLNRIRRKFSKLNLRRSVTTPGPSAPE